MQIDRVSRGFFIAAAATRVLYFIPHLLFQMLQEQLWPSIAYLFGFTADPDIISVDHQMLVPTFVLQFLILIGVGLIVCCAMTAGGRAGVPMILFVITCLVCILIPGLVEPVVRWIESMMSGRQGASFVAATAGAQAVMGWFGLLSTVSWVLLLVGATRLSVKGRGQDPTPERCP